MWGCSQLTAALPGVMARLEDGGFVESKPDEDEFIKATAL
jgi:hypothetical protein